MHSYVSLSLASHSLNTLVIITSSIHKYGLSRIRIEMIPEL